MSENHKFLCLDCYFDLLITYKTRNNGGVFNSSVFFEGYKQELSLNKYYNREKYLNGNIIRCTKCKSLIFLRPATDNSLDITYTNVTFKRDPHFKNHFHQYYNRVWKEHGLKYKKIWTLKKDTFSGRL